ncbi:coagulation factor XIII B chain [Xenopus tropicalis]|uniref:Coagulation factor XIII B chain n=1 Tax=Xenopus tropicalis TaxID=8364 RepID=A0A6I8PQF3_XENTR|nr:coagulation factor XIII B chain [Xenopus tropicalis]
MSVYKFCIFLLCPWFCFAQENGCDLPVVENGKIAQYYYVFKKFYFPMKEGKKLSLSCTAGYTTQSGKQEEQITCKGKGWEPAPFCFKKCIKPSLNHGNVCNPKESYKFQETAHYSCSEGYVTVSGNQTEEIQCLTDGWSSQPECHQISDGCEAPQLPNGHYTTTKKVFHVKETLQYQCDEGYGTPSGRTADVSECLLRGWSSVPQCTKQSCKELQSVQNGGFYPVKAMYVDRDVVQFFCTEGYILRGSELIQCYSFGWYPEPASCEEKNNKCPPPPRPAHIILLTDPAVRRNGDSARYECDHNYMLTGSEEIHCENGRWTSPPSCVELKEKIKCVPPPYVENGKMMQLSEVYYSGDRVNFQCAEGFEIQGSSEIICKLGKWPEAPKCKAKSDLCQMPPPLTNGELIALPSLSYKNGEVVQYRCKSYHLMEGPKTVNCTHGKWTELPTCLEPCTVSVDQMKQKNLELKWSFEIDTYFLHGDMMEFVCKDDFDMSEHSELKGLCQRGNIIYPTCSRKDKLKTCGPPPLVQNGRVLAPREYYESGSSAVYMCSEHHFLNGSNTVQCSDGHWDHPPTCISPCVLSKEEMERNQIRLRWSFDNKDYFFHGEYIEFLCKDGHENTHPTILFSLRAQCSKGQIEYPNCVPRAR